MQNVGNVGNLKQIAYIAYKCTAKSSDHFTIAYIAYNTYSLAAASFTVRSYSPHAESCLHFAGGVGPWGDRSR